MNTIVHPAGLSTEKMQKKIEANEKKPFDFKKIWIRIRLMKTPTITDLASLIRSIKSQVCDDYIEEKGDIPSIQLTIGCGPNGWNYQTGDNSFTGGAYGHPFWGVGYVTRRCNSRQLAKEIINDALSQQH